MGGCVTKEEVISRSQYLKLVYSQSGTLYELLPDVPHPSTNPSSSQSPVTPPVDGVIGTMADIDSNAPKTSSKYKSTTAIVPPTPSHNHKNPGKNSEVNAVQSTATNKSSKGKKKDKGKYKSKNPKQDSKNSYASDYSTCKPKYPCLICDDDHYTKDFPQRAEFARVLKGVPGTPTVVRFLFGDSQDSISKMDYRGIYWLCHL